MFVRKPFPGQFALAQPFYAPDEDFGGPGYVEQPGDREPDPAAPDPEPEPAADPEPEPEAAPEGAEEPEAAADPDPDPEPEEPAKPRKDWRDRQIIKAREKAREEAAARQAAETQAAETAKRLAAYEALYGKPEGEAPAPEPDGERRYTQAEVNEQAQRIAAFNDLNRRAEQMFDVGKAAHKDWEQRINELGEAFGDELPKRLDFFDVLTDLPNGADVYHALASDLDRMEDLLRLSPTKMAARLALMSSDIKAKAAAPPERKGVSKVPPPIKPLDKPGSGERPLEDLINDPTASMEEIDRRMRASEEQRYAQRR